MSDYKEKFEKMRVAGKLASKTLDMLTDYIKPGYQQIRLINQVMNLLKIMAAILLHYFIEVLKNHSAHL